MLTLPRQNPWDVSVMHVPMAVLVDANAVAKPHVPEIVREAPAHLVMAANRAKVHVLDVRVDAMAHAAVVAPAIHMLYDEFK